MPALPANLKPLAKQFVWLLREDIRAATNHAGVDSNAFNQWWLMRGRAEYPGWSALDEAEKQFLSEKTGKLSLGDINLPLPRALSLVLNYRPDVVQKFTVSGQLDSLGVTAWFFAYGVDEMLLDDAIDAEMRAELDRPVTQTNLDNSDVPAATLLMRLTWQLLDPTIRETMPLEDANSRARFMAWFFSAANSRFKLTSLIANRWRQWLKQSVNITPNLALPRFVSQTLNLSPEFQQRFDLNSVEGRQQINQWSQRAQEQGQTWSWLKSIQQNSSAKPSISDLAFGVNLYGFAFGELGIGEDLRMAVAACESAGIPYRVMNIEAGKDLRQADNALKHHVSRAVAEAPYAINVFCLPGFDTVARVFLQRGDQLFRNHYNIGWWPWELSVWPAAWNQAFSLMDEIWAGSDFARQMYANSTSLPVQLMPLPVSVDRGVTRPRSFFNLPTNQFLYLFVFDFNSHLARKNPMAVIESFSLAFSKHDSSVGLVLKVMNAKGDNPNWQAFLNRCQQDSRIHLVQETLDREDVLALIECCDAYVSLHRCEGFGRTLAEAMCYGKPVIGTNYSGNIDFMPKAISYPVNYRLTPISAGEYHFVTDSDQAVWAEADVEHAAKQMQQARQDAKKAGYAQSVKDYAKSQFSPNRIGQLMLKRLNNLPIPS
jgi:glycosyltransferase involved in cell wall biosynthesis